MFHLEDRLFRQQNDFQRPFPNQNSEQLISGAIIPQLTNIVQGNRNLNVDFAKNDITV